ncbi:SNO glutamine amidotransferase, partial [Sistotremastrum suecicum HHB10207 ss-3]
VKPLLVKTVQDLAACDALIIPGGESTTIALLARLSGLLEPLREFVKSGKPVWGTCAGAILLSEEVRGTKKGGQETLGGVGIVVERNGWGSQVESFEASLEVDGLRDPNRPFLGVFIRSPLIVSILPPPLPPAPAIQVLARLTADHLPMSDDPNIVNDDDPTDPRDDRTVVALRQGRVLITTFHPELTKDDRFHEYFIKQCILAK